MCVCVCIQIVRMGRKRVTWLHETGLGIPKCLIVPPWIKAVFSRGTGCGWGWCYGIHLNGGRCVCPESGKEKLPQFDLTNWQRRGCLPTRGSAKAKTANGEWRRVGHEGRTVSIRPPV